MDKESKFKLTARCRKCGYVITKEVEADVRELAVAKAQFAREVGQIHKEHPGAENFGILDKLV